MEENLSHVSQDKKALLIEKLKLNFDHILDNQSSEGLQFDRKKPFGYVIPNSNFAKIKTINYAISPPGPGQVQIECKAISLNFRDLMISLGLYPKTDDVPTAMGSDYAGVVVACGQEVDNFKVGDEVMAVHGGDPAIDCHFCSRINAFTHQTVLKPKKLSFQEACCIPTVFLTAYLALYDLARLSKGEKVLIHHGSGGVGLAAIQVAKWRQAKLFTTAGSPEKRKFLSSLGISYVMDSRSVNFYDQIMEYTLGEGVDVILNTLFGEALEKGLGLLKNFGRFIQLNKTDIYQKRMIDMGFFKKGLSFSFFDLSLFYLDPRTKIALEAVCELFNDHVFSPLPFRLFHHSNVGSALNSMATPLHIGKVVLDYGY